MTITAEPVRGTDVPEMPGVQRSAFFVARTSDFAQRSAQLSQLRAAVPRYCREVKESSQQCVTDFDK
jgi:hypothetical protein